MDLASDITKIRELVVKANDILVVTHDNPTHDSIGSTLALYLGLSGMGKKVIVAIPEPVTVEFSNYIGINKMTNDIAQKNFVISLDYKEGSIEKVSYNIEGDTFNLVIEPRPGFASFTSDNVHFSHAGSAADLILTVDTIHLGGLRKIYEADKNLFASRPVVNIDRHPNNAHFGQINLVDATSASTAELIYSVLKGLNAQFSQDIATNLINAVYMATSNFQSPYVSAATFEAVADLIRAGGKRLTRGEPEEPFEPRVTGGVQQAPVAVREPTSAATEPLPAAEEVPASRRATKPEPAGQGKQPPADWLKPKIFKSSSVR
ncbi:hypothetical protein A2Z33_02375 [Candidatus Gottesmanbacteria bacterium RBG_16_52_11]|uniref:DDH domain-containing protein n=1 Tax=Candidatus Gottesmanbacteria bacterium RBG_16_52_11 TaxID=1798374 RepID=A0A1F5YN99_9BACT|nr:MAG: hypothetical protein A2Z33_02375 [Candidatus Gottesmanbacteria bacterium RBG_16_52_11]